MVFIEPAGLSQRKETLQYISVLQKLVNVYNTFFFYQEHS